MKNNKFEKDKDFQGLTVFCSMFYDTVSLWSAISDEHLGGISWGAYNIITVTVVNNSD